MDHRDAHYPPGGAGASHPTRPPSCHQLPRTALHPLKGAIGAGQAAFDATIWNLEPSGDV